MLTDSPTLWEYSTHYYSNPAIASCCLTLQNQYRQDVNIIFLCYWHGTYHGEISFDKMSAILSFSAEWHKIAIHPLRSARTDLKVWTNQQDKIVLKKESYESFRENIKTIELEAEKIQQQSLMEFCLGGIVKDFESSSGSASAARKANIKTLVSLQNQFDNLVTLEAEFEQLAELLETY